MHFSLIFLLCQSLFHKNYENYFSYFFSIVSSQLIYGFKILHQHSSNVQLEDDKFGYESTNSYAGVLSKF